MALSTFTNPAEKTEVTQALTETGHEIIDISFEQMSNFAGNMLEIQTEDNKSILAGA